MSACIATVIITFVIDFVDYICISVGVPVSGSTVFSSEQVCARPEEAEYGGVHPQLTKDLRRAL